MAYDAKTQRLISLKKLAGKAHTSNDKDLANEGLPCGLTLASNTIFGNSITTEPSESTLYTITGDAVEYLRFPATFIAGTDTSAGRHGFSLKLPSDYEANSSNTKAGTYPFINNQTINITSGALQLVPPAFANAYEAKPYYDGDATKGSGTRIAILDARDWYLDYFNGIMFQQDPPGTGDHSNNPDFVEAYLYIGDMLNTVVANSGGGGGDGDKNAQFLVLQATGSLNAERVLTMGTGMSSSDGGAGGNFTINVDDSIVATLTGSQFSGNVGVTGSFGATLGLSGSLTKLHDGTSYLKAGSNITITSASNGSVTIASTAAPTDPVMKIYEVTGSHASSQPLVFPSIDFTTNGRSFEKNQIFLNGVLMASGSTFDYTLDLTATGSIVFNMALKVDDILIVRQT